MDYTKILLSVFNYELKGIISQPESEAMI